MTLTYFRILLITLQTILKERRQSLRECLMISSLSTNVEMKMIFWLLIGAEKTFQCVDDQDEIKDDGDATVLFHHPGKTAEVIDRIINYRLRFDGIKCSEYSTKGNTYYELGLEIANCNEEDRKNGLMTCQGMVFREKEKSIEAVKNYLLRVTVLGMHGFWTKVRISQKKSVWYHWRWFIGSIVCDTVAQEELIGFLNKKFTEKPCVFCNADRVRYNPELYILHLFSSTLSSFSKQRDLTFPCCLYCGLHPLSFYRCASLICWNKELVEQHLDKDIDKKEVESISKLFGLFPDNTLHQYLPVAVASEDVEKFNDDLIRSVGNKTELKNDVNSMVAYLHKKKPPTVRDNVNALDGTLLIPCQQALGLDGMHSLYNACLNFIKLLNTQSHQKKVLDHSLQRMVVGCGVEDPEWSLYPNFEDIKSKADKRREQLMKFKLPHTNEDLLTLSNFKTVSDYKGIMFLCSYYHYLFQDSMDIPFIFLYKIVLDYLVFFFNTNSNLNSIVEHQLNFNIIVSLLQNEVAPSILKPTLHYACHYASTILNTGAIYASDCFISEAYYKLLKGNFIPCGNSGLTMSKRALGMKITGLLAKENSQKKKSVSLYPDNTIDQLPTLSEDLLIKLGKCNIYDELMYYKDSSYAKITILDLLLDKDSTEWEGIVDDYIQNNQIDRLFRCSRSVSIHSSSFRDVIDEDEFLNDLFFTRLKNGSLLVFYVIGEVKYMIEGEEYVNYLCWDVPVISGCSCVNTSLYGFLDLDKFSDEQNVFVLSQKRIIENHVTTFPFDDFTCFMTNKLVPRQYSVLEKCPLYSILNTL